MTSSMVLEVSHGVRAVLVHRPGAHGATVVTHVGVGYHDDPVGLPGMAHLFEHLMTQDSEPPATSSSLAAAQAAGGTGGASTHAQYSEFWYRAPLSLVPELVHGASRRLAEPVFTPDHLAQQLDGIEREIADRRRGSTLGRFPWPAFPATMYADWPYGHDGLGDPDALRRVTYEMCRTFHAERYLAAPVVLTVAADLRTGPGAIGLEELLQASLGNLPARPEQPARPAPELRPSARDGVTLPGATQPLAAVARPVPGAGESHAVHAALAVVASALKDAEGGRHAPVPLWSGGLGWHGACDIAGGDVFLAVVAADGAAGDKVIESLDARLNLLGSSAGASALDKARARTHARFVAELESSRASACWAGRGALLFDRPHLLPETLTLIERLPTSALAGAAADMAGLPAALLVGHPGSGRAGPEQVSTPARAMGDGSYVGGAATLLVLPKLAQPEMRVERHGTLDVIWVRRPSQCIEGRMLIHLSKIPGRLREILRTRAGSRCAAEPGFGAVTAIWLGDTLLLSSRHPRADVDEGALADRWRILGEDVVRFAAEVSHMTDPGTRTDWWAHDLAVLSETSHRRPCRTSSTVVLVGAAAFSDDVGLRLRPRVPAQPGTRARGVRTHTVPGSALGSALLIGAPGGASRAASHLAVAVLMGVGRLGVNQPGVLSGALNGVVTGGREPCAAGPPRPFLRASCEAGALGPLLAEIDGLVHAACDVPDEEVRAANAFCRGQWALAFDDSGPLADQLAQHVAFGGDPGRLAAFADELDATPVEQVRQTLATMFAAAKLSGAAVDATDVRLPPGWACGANVRSNPPPMPDSPPRGEFAH